MGSATSYMEDNDQPKEEYKNEKEQSSSTDYSGNETSYSDTKSNESNEDDKTDLHVTIDDWGEFSKVIKEHNIPYIELMNLSYDDRNGFLNKTNMPIFSSNVTSQPIIIAGSQKARELNMIIRYVDSEHNKKEGIPGDGCSFLIISLQPLAHCGLMWMTEDIKWYKDNVTGKHKAESEIDTGENEIVEYVCKLIRGDFEHKKLKCGEDTMKDKIAKVLRALEDSFY